MRHHGSVHMVWLLYRIPASLEHPIFSYLPHWPISSTSLTRSSPRMAGVRWHIAAEPPSPAMRLLCQTLAPIPYLDRRGLTRGARWCPLFRRRSCRRRTRHRLLPPLLYVRMTGGACVSAPASPSCLARPLSRPAQ
jgi:hypothetical protein